jgi:hypothetical protein
MLEALQKKYEAEVAMAEANINVYLKNPAGIGEHPEIVEAVDKQIEKLSTAQEKLDTVIKLLKQSMELRLNL